MGPLLFRRAGSSALSFRVSFRSVWRRVLRYSGKVGIWRGSIGRGRSEVEIYNIYATLSNLRNFKYFTLFYLVYVILSDVVILP